jgi:hypothetical protein
MEKEVARLLQHEFIENFCDRVDPGDRARRQFALSVFSVKVVCHMRRHVGAVEKDFARVLTSHMTSYILKR